MNILNGKIGKFALATLLNPLVILNAVVDCNSQRVQKELT